MYSNYTTNQSSVRLQPITSVKRRIVRDKYQYSKLTPFGHSWNHYGPTRIDPGPVSDRIPDRIFDHPGPSLGPSLDSTGAKSGLSLDQLQTTSWQTHGSSLVCCGSSSGPTLSQPWVKLWAKFVPTFDHPFRNMCTWSIVRSKLLLV